VRASSRRRLRAYRAKSKHYVTLRRAASRAEFSVLLEKASDERAAEQNVVAFRFPLWFPT